MSLKLREAGRKEGDLATWRWQKTEASSKCKQLPKAWQGYYTHQATAKENLRGWVKKSKCKWGLTWIAGHSLHHHHLLLGSGFLHFLLPNSSAHVCELSPQSSICLCNKPQLGSSKILCLCVSLCLCLSVSSCFKTLIQRSTLCLQHPLTVHSDWDFLQLTGSSSHVLNLQLSHFKNLFFTEEETHLPKTRCSSEKGKKAGFFRHVRRTSRRISSRSS